jgi:hypothetical protein
VGPTLYLNSNIVAEEPVVALVLWSFLVTITIADVFVASVVHNFLENNNLIWKNIYVVTVYRKK